MQVLDQRIFLHRDQPYYQLSLSKLIILVLLSHYRSTWIDWKKSWRLYESLSTCDIKDYDCCT